MLTRPLHPRASSPGAIRPSSALALTASLIAALSGCTYAYQFLQGTSMAAPHAAGLAALIRGHEPSLGVAQVAAQVGAIFEGIDIVLEPVGALPAPDGGARAVE